MAKVIAPFKIVGSLDDLTFYIDQQGQNRVREKGKTGVSKEAFQSNPVFDKVKKHSREFSRAIDKAKTFRAIAYPFFNRAKDGSFAGRANKLMFEIIAEDKVNSHGERTFENGIQSNEAKTYPIGFEGNSTRPLYKVLKAKWNWNETSSTFTIKKFNPKTDINWPEEATHIHLALCRANWNHANNEYDVEFSKEIILDNEDTESHLQLTTKIPKGNQLQLAYLFIGFSTKVRNKTKELKRSNNTTTILWSV
ncbi:hypothetical protein [Flavobacterium sp.]|uniref:hypothetical protein n=1 Tax=Flavobacterium sp. TaxID=239 RepID=UPI0025EE1FFE|nr:hypothetical protein [Flavobacterium sp.]